MKPKKLNPFILLAAGSSLLAVSQLHALDGTWNNSVVTGSTNWTTPGMWTSNQIADGAGFTANFTGVNITGARTVALNGNRTIGNIIFTDATTSSNDLTISGNTLNLDVTSGAPQIDVTQSGRTLTISSALSGNEGFTKLGTGTLSLGGTKTGLTGPITVSAGTLTLTAGAFDGVSATTTINVSSGATLTSTMSNGFGAGTSGGGSGQPAGAWTIAGTLNGNGAGNSGQTMPASVTLNGGTLAGTSTGGTFGTFLLGGATTVTATGTSAWGGTSVGLFSPLTLSPTNSGDILNVTAQIGASSVLSGSLIKNGAGTVTLNASSIYTGGTTVNAGTLTLAHATNSLSSGAVTVNGGELALGTNTDSVGAVTLTGGSITGSGTGTLTGTSYAVQSGTISAKLGGTAVALTKTTGGLVTISSDNSSGGYTGATNVNGGKLTISSTGNINNTSGVSIGAGEFNYNASTALTKAVTFSSTGGTLSGSGTITPTLTITAGNTLAIGNSVGQMNFGSGLILAGTTVMEIDGTAGAGLTGGNDFANVTGGTLTYGGTMTLDIGMIFGEGTYTWNLFDFTGGDLGTFSTITLADQYSGSLQDGNNDGIWDLTSGDNTWQFTESTGVLGLTVIPEPSTALLGALGLLALLRRRRA